MVDRTSGVPAYRQIADDLRAKIESGELESGAPLPSERELVELYEASRPTIREAIKLLRNQGLVIAEHGRGVFVRPAPVITRLARNRLSRAARGENKGAFLSDAAAAGFVPEVSVRVRVESADERVAELLHIESGADVLVRDRVMRADKDAVQLAVSRFPRDLTEGTPIEETDTGTGGVYARLEDTGHELTYFDELVSARMPTADELSVLQLPDGVPVITVTRVAYSATRPVEVNDIVMAANRYELRYTLPAD